MAADQILKSGGDFGGHIFFNGSMAVTKYSANLDIWRWLGSLMREHKYKVKIAI